MSKIGKLWDIVYGKLCGVHPYLKPWHFQWLFVHHLYRDLRQVLPSLKGDVLDVGCGRKPYKTWLASGVRYAGLDITFDSEPDILVKPGEPWNIESESFDAVICTQVLEHVSDPEQFLREIHRVLRPGGTLILTVPFVFPEHELYDYWRWSKMGICNLVNSSGFIVIDCKSEGHTGSVLGGLFLSYIYSKKVNRVIIAVLLPLWILTCMIVNTIGVIIDGLDTRNVLYSNIFVRAQKVDRKG